MPDIDMEWAKFEKEVIDASEEKSKVDSVKYKVNGVKWRVDSRIWSRAAMITGIIMSVSLITLASIYLYSTPQEKTEPQKSSSELTVTAPVQEIIKTDTLTINCEWGTYALAFAQAHGNPYFYLSRTGEYELNGAH